MEYFWLKQSLDILQKITPEKYPVPYRNIKIKEQDETAILQNPEPKVYKIKKFVEPDKIPDFIEIPFPLVSAELKKVLYTYQPGIISIPITFVEPVQGSVHPFWRVFPPKIQGLAKNTKLTVNQGLIEVTLDRAKIGGAAVFSLAGVLNNILIVRLDVAESIYRKNIRGLVCEKIQGVEGGEIK